MVVFGRLCHLTGAGEELCLGMVAPRPNYPSCSNSNQKAVDETRIVHGFFFF